MYSRFKVTLEKSDFIEMKNDTSNNFTGFLAESSQEDKEDKIKGVLHDLLLDNGDLDATKIWDEWFPITFSNVFISHSHKDESDAKVLAKWLYQKFSITSFIDSTVWGYADDLLQEIDNNFCLNHGEDTYNYKKRNISTAHVHMVLTSALTMMLDKTECIMFLNTPNSINTQDNISGNTTYSPWIFNELLTSKLLNRKYPDRVIAALDSVSGMEEFRESLKVQYPDPLEHLTELDNNDLQDWNLKVINRQRPYDNLDLLYKIKGITPKL